MFPSLDFYYFSPTGGVKKVAAPLATALATAITPHDFGSKQQPAGESEFALIAAPVYGGRIPALVADKLQHLAGTGRKAITMVVYGNRAYEDALLELNDCAQAAGFTVVASGAFIAEHSVSRAVAAGRPDAQDVAELQAFAREILAKLERGDLSTPTVPGNRPYKAGMNAPFTPIFLPECGGCGTCARLCPVGAISHDECGRLVTDVQKCILCMACVACCPRKARILPPPVQETMDTKLRPLINIHRENEPYL